MSGCLCEELTVEIFKRLPAKSLLRFRSLSKSLYSIISSPDFIRMHTNISPQKLLIRHRNDNSEDFFTLHAEDKSPLCPSRGYFRIRPVKFPYDRRSSIVGSCNGILCLEDKEKHSISLWNPSIRRKLYLPACPKICASGVFVGFGFDSVTDDYKIVCVSNARCATNAESSFVYSMKTGSWCAIASPKPFNWNIGISKACFVNGTLHWLVRKYRTSPENEDDFYIMTFNLSSHVFGMIELQEPKQISIELTVIQGCLAVISMLGDNNSSIWVRRDASWSVFLEWKGTRVEGTIVNVLQASINGSLLIYTYYEGLKVYNVKLGYIQSRLVHFTAASLRMVEMELCSESLYLLDVGTALEGN